MAGYSYERQRNVEVGKEIYSVFFDTSHDGRTMTKLHEVIDAETTVPISLSSPVVPAITDKLNSMLAREHREVDKRIPLSPEYFEE